jgi:hypothetical protein
MPFRDFNILALDNFPNRYFCYCLTGDAIQPGWMSCRRPSLPFWDRGLVDVSEYEGQELDPELVTRVRRRQLPWKPECNDNVRTQ